ncbi:MAG: rhomboid family intramembrane serine protease, partial [Gammaproteobacteria bacterium]|nr:rhomboid family intramembrane serine protease [Gammaproteobacteria bacterium]
MVIIPYSTALRLSKPPIVTYAMTLLCMLIFAAQVSSDITESLLYYPETWNPLKMLTSSLAHGGLFHLMGNMVFYLAFAPALEVLIGNKLKYVWIM